MFPKKSNEAGMWGRGEVDLALAGVVAAACAEVVVVPEAEDAEEEDELDEAKTLTPNPDNITPNKNTNHAVAVKSLNSLNAMPPDVCRRFFAVSSYCF